MKINTRLLLSFSLATFFIILVGSYGIWQMSSLADLTAKMYRHPLTVSNAVHKLNTNIIKMHRHMKDVALAKDNTQLETAITLVNRYEILAHQEFDIIKKRFLGDQKDVDSLMESFVAWKPIRDEVIALIRSGDKDAAAEITKAKGADHVNVLEKKMQVLINFASNKADEFMSNAEQQEVTSYQLLFSLIVIVTVFSLWVAISTWHVINNSLKQSIFFANKIAEGYLTNMIEHTRRDEFGQLFKNFDEMQSQLRGQIHAITEFLKNLSEGKTDDEISSQFKGDFSNLKDALQLTAKQLAEMRQKNEIEAWLKNGQAQLNEKVSGEQEIKQLAENVINFLTPYISAQVGVLHLLVTPKEAEPYLKIIASHAYKQRDGMSSITQIGEGLVGQAAYERKLFTISHTNHEDIKIQSSIEESSPKEIVVIPFLYEEELKGVLEFASLTALTDIQLTFLEQVMPSVGIAVNTAESRMKMQFLVEERERAV